MAKTSLREVLEAIAAKARRNTKEGDGETTGDKPAPPSGKAASDAPPTQESATALKARYTKRLTELTAQVKALSAPTDLLAKLRGAASALKDGDLVRVAESLKEIESGLSDTDTQTRPKLDDVELAPADPLHTPQALADVVKPRLKLRALESAYELAVGNLEVACRAMLRTEAFETDPMSEDAAVQAAIDAIGERVPDVASVSAQVQVALAKLAKAAAADQAKTVAPALAALATYRQAIDGEPLLREMQTCEAGNFRIHSALSEALDELVESLSR